MNVNDTNDDYDDDDNDNLRILRINECIVLLFEQFHEISLYIS